MELKIAFLIFVIGVSNLFATNSYSQVTRISIDLENKSLEQVMDEIERQSEFYFIFNQKQIDVNRVVDIQAKNELITDVLPELFIGTDVNYAVLDRKILLTTDPLENNLKSVSSEAGLQQVTVRGTVTDAKTGDALTGVNIVVTGTTFGAITDNAGKYSIEVPMGSKSLSFSFIGMENQEITIGTLTQINVTMVEIVTGLEEVVVVGYGTARKATITGSIVSVKGGELGKAPVTNVSNSLLGLLPGLSSVQRSGEPGRDASTIMIRGVNTLGNNNPLVVVDGVAGRSLERIDPTTIESITVLKDASAAIYGAQAANGVILITTKRGIVGKPQITINLNEGFNQPTVIPEMCNSWQYATMLNEIDFYAGRLPRTSDLDIQKFKANDDPWGYPNTDWFGEVLKPWSNQNEMDVSMTGGTEGVKYFVSIGSKFQDGFYHNSATNYKQYNFTSNIDGQITKNIGVSVDVQGRMQHANNTPRTANTIFRMLLRGDPRMHAFWPDGTPGEDIGEGDNPAIISTAAEGYDNDKTYVLNSNIKLNIKVPWIKGLAFTGNLSIDKTFQYRKVWQQPWYLYSWDKSSYDENGKPVLVPGIKGFTDARLQQYAVDDLSKMINGVVTYEKKFGESTINFLAGMEGQSGTGNSFNAYRRYFISTALDQLSLGGDLLKDNGGSGSESARLNYFGRVNYNYMEKYLVEFVWRYDGSYIFPQKGRFGFFPGFSAGWRLSQEQFWKDNLAFINTFKLRGSWGQTGNDRISNFQYLSTYSFGGLTIFGNGVQSKTLSAGVIPNPNVTWEVANQAGVGFDATLLNDKLSVVLDLYSNKRTNILAYRDASVPASTGLTLPRENIGEVVNKGFELTVGYNNQVGDLNYGISFNSGYAKNKILFWDEPEGVLSWQQSTGYPVNAALYYQAIGIFNDDAELEAYPHWTGARLGDIIFKDVNDDGLINGLDRVRNDLTTVPNFTAGLNLNLKYKAFDLSVLFQGAAGVVRYFNTESGDVGNYHLYDFEGRWTVDNPNANKPRTYNRDDAYWKSQESTWYLLNSSYIRLKSLELGFTVPSSINSKLGIRNLRIYVSGFNLLTYAPGLHDVDPETQTAGIYGGTYMPSRVVNGGITLNF